MPTTMHILYTYNTRYLHAVCCMLYAVCYVLYELWTDESYDHCAIVSALGWVIAMTSIPFQISHVSTKAVSF
ncbi:hypothetical protein BKA67DRAFT_571977 [Truncatella angustata]|uniref:Uncharacterized protein n=1 Tax=Truncatella angustata TaxID=152316 RepID=A0A9P8UGQ2_9PEZI|nr:uncharacterized protein BKA67DRAFT_571977 [Truncatella angustata]KAH6651815.1 hypothetical protein BKA67DRAFT_571977 [Truncatella angustata]